MQSNTTINICIANSCFYIASLNNDMFRPLYRPSSGCTFSYFLKQTIQYTIFLSTDLVNINKIRIYNNYSSSGIKSYSEMKDKQYKKLGV